MNARYSCCGETGGSEAQAAQPSYGLAHLFLRLGPYRSVRDYTMRMQKRAYPFFMDRLVEIVLAQARVGLFRSALGENALQSTPMHVEAARGLGDVAVA